MTYEIYKRFSEFEKQIMAAKNNNYTRFEHRDFLKFGEIVKDWRGKELTRNEKSCSKCLLTLTKQVADDYIKYQNSPGGKKKIAKENGIENGEDNNADVEG